MDINKNCKTLLQVYDEDLQRLEKRVGKDRSINSLKVMLQGRKYVASYLIQICGDTDIMLSELTPQMIYDFSVWLSVDKGLRGGTVWLATMQLKGVVTRAHQRGELSWNPFAGFRQPKNIRPREFLTEEEILRLIHKKLSKPHLQMARDVFVVACFTGLSFIDIQELTVHQIVNVGGSRWIISRRHKTKVPFQVKLLPIVCDIVDHYIAINGDEKVFADLHYRTLAKQVKQLMVECGISKNISMHCGRHTFAMMALNRGMPIESVSRILGHTNITTTQIYAKISMRKLDADFDSLSERLHLIYNI